MVFLDQFDNKYFQQKEIKFHKQRSKIDHELQEKINCSVICGGCKVQQLDYEEQIAQKKQQVEIQKRIEIDGEVSLVASNIVKVSKDESKNILTLLEQLDDHDDIQKVHTNFEIE